MIRNRFALVSISLVAHLALIAFGFSGIAGTPMGDISLYEVWNQEIHAGQIYGINTPWVYPYVNLIFILLPNLLIGVTNYFNAWLVISVFIDVVALLTLVKWRGEVTKARANAALIWIGLGFLLGPVSVSRLDNLSVAFAVIGVAALLNEKSAIASAWFAFAVWIKVWPVALLLALAAATNKLKASLVAALVVAVSLLVIGLALGSGNALTFLTSQNTRGIEFEAPLGMWWVWAAALKFGDSYIYFDEAIRAVQLHGPLVQEVANLSGIALVIALLITAFLAYQARVNSGDSRPHEVFAWVAITAALDLIVFNRVGSPQYYAWLFVPVIYAVATGVKSFKPMTALVALLSFMTFLIYPILFDQIWLGDISSVSFLTARNALLIAALVYANIELSRLGRITNRVTQ